MNRTLENTTVLKKTRRADFIVMLCFAVYVCLDIMFMPSGHPIIIMLLRLGAGTLLLSALTFSANHERELCRALNSARPIFFTNMAASRLRDAMVSIRDAHAAMHTNTPRHRDIPRKILLAGPPGTGKRMAARALANELHVPFISVPRNFFDVTWLPGLGKPRDLAMLANEKAPCVLFLQGTSQAVKDTLKNLNSYSRTKDVLVIVSQDQSVQSDTILSGFEQFDAIINVTLPDAAERDALLDHFLTFLECEPGLDKAQLVHVSEGIPPSNMGKAVAWASFVATKERTKISTKHLLEALYLHGAKPSWL